MKNNYQSKAVPRGTRTIWRYLSALLILFTFAIGNVWAEDYVWNFSKHSTWTYSSSDKTVTLNSVQSLAADAEESDSPIVLTYQGNSTSDKIKASSHKFTVGTDEVTLTNQLWINGATSSSRVLSITGLSGKGTMTLLGTTGSNRSVGMGIASGNMGNADHYTYGKFLNAAKTEVTSINITTALTSTTTYYINVSGSYALYALIWTPENTDGPFAVAYDKNNEGASGTMTDTNSPYAKNASVTVLGNSFTAPTGMFFAGWNTKANGSGTSYAAGDSFSATEDVTLYAQWAYPATGTGTITYALTSNKNEVTPSVSGVSTLSSSSTAFALSTLTCGSGNEKPGYSGQIQGHAVDYSASQYVALQFTVTDGYTFTPSSLSFVTWVRSSNVMKTKVVISDGITSIESNELTSTADTDCPITFAADAFTGKKFTGNVNITMYQWGAASKRSYIKSPVTITGTVATAAPKYDVVFANGGEGEGSMATLKYEAGEQVTLPDCGYTPASGREFDGWTSSDVTISAGKFTMPSKNVTITATWRDEAVKYTVTYDVNGGSSATPTETDKAAGDEFALAAAPEYEGYHFEGWLCDVDAVTYDAEGAYTMTAANTKFTAQWKPYSTISIANKTYIIGSGNFNAVSDFSSNCEAAVIYELKESYPGVTLTPAGVFSATAAGEYIVVANQAGDATYAATSKEFTVTVLDNELSDTYVWKKNASYTGCIANPNADAPAAQYTDIAYEGFTGMGRAAADNTECILTFSVKAAYSATFGIKSICTYGKLEEPLGGQISWDGGANWEDLAAYAEGKKEFNAPAATFPTSFKIRFLGVSAGTGGLWWRNALVTLEVKKTVSGVTEALVGAEINGEAISAANLSTLQEDKTLDIATAYAAAPTVTFKKQVTTSYAGGWAPDVENVDVEVTASDNTTAWQASATIGGQAYIINLAKPAGPSLETEATAFTLTSAKIATDTKSFTFSGLNLAHSVTISLESDVAGLSVTPAVVIPTDDAITNQEVTITYKSLENVAEAVVNLVVAYDVDTKITIPLTYSSTVGYEDLTPISAATTWNWDGAASAAYGTLGQNDMIILANADVTWDEGFNARAIAGALQHYYREGKYAQGNSLKFNTTIPGKVYVKFSNTGGKDIARAPRITDANGTYAPTDESEGSKNTTAIWYNHSVAAGDVVIEGFEMKDPIALNMLRYYEVRFAPVFAVTYDAGEGSVKGGETMPTQADEAAGEKIILAAATALEKDGYDFAGWLCDIDAQTYQPGDEYTMTAAATTFTAQWVLHVEPVDPTLTYDDGDYMVGSAALDLSSLITEKTSTGAITYSVKDAGTTGAAIDGNNFTATAAGTATITASQAAVLGYNAKTVDFSVVVTEATEIDGIKLVEAGALTGNFRVKANQLKEGAYTVEGINYAKYVQMGSTHTNFSGETEGNQSKGIYYAPMKKNITFWFYMQNTESSTTRKIYVYTIEEGKAITSKTVDVEAGSHLVSTDITLTTNAEIVFGVENTKLYFCQIVAVESGDDLLQGGQAGYVFDYSKKRQNVAANILRTIDGVDYKLYAESKINSASNVQLQTLGTHYIKFHLDAPMTVNVFADNKKYYIGSECSTEDAAMTYEATGDGEFSLAAGDWYINGSGVQVKINKLSFSAPKCEQPTITPMSNSDLCEGNAFEALTVTASVSDGGTLHYAWFKEAGADDEAVGTDAASYTPEADGEYYVVVTNRLADHSDNSATSNTITVTHYGAPVITSAPLNKRGEVDDVVTLTVAATGKNVSYKWYTCDEDGSNEVALDPAETGTSLNVTVTAGMSQWYKVIVTSDCGNAEAKAKVSEFEPTTPATVTESIVWDWTSSVWPASGTAAFTNEDAPDYELLADADAIVPNAEGFRSDMLYGKGQYVWRYNNQFFQGSAIKFTSTVAGMVRVYFRSTSGGKTVEVAINGTSAGSRTNSFGWSSYVEVPAGEVEMICTGDGYTRIQKIEFLALADRREAAWVAPGELGTVCLKDDAKAVGANVYELQGCNANGYMVFDQIVNGEIEAGKPYLFEATRSGNVSFYKTIGANHVESVETDPEITKGMYGTFDEEHGFDLVPDAGNYYYFSGRHIWSVNDFGVTINVPAYRCYVDYDEFKTHPVSSMSPAPGRRRVVLGVNGKQVATGMENVESDNVQSTKLLINGQLFILRGEKMYDATGRLVK